MTRHLAGTKPLSEPILEYCQLDPWEQTSVNASIEIYMFSFKIMHLNMLPGKWRPTCLCFSVLKYEHKSAKIPINPCTVLGEILTVRHCEQKYVPVSVGLHGRFLSNSESESDEPVEGMGRSVGRDDGRVWWGGMACSCLVAMRTGFLDVILGGILWWEITVRSGLWGVWSCFPRWCWSSWMPIFGLFLR